MALQFTACTRSEDVVGKGWLQQRKYRKGFHWNPGYKSQSGKATTKIAVGGEPANEARLAAPEKMAPRPVASIPARITGQAQKEPLAQEMAPQAAGVLHDPGKHTLPVQADIMRVDDTEPDEPENGKTKNEENFRLTAVLAFGCAVIACVLAMASVFTELGPVIFSLILILLAISLVSLSLAPFYLLAILRNRKGEHLFTKSFRKTAGVLSFVAIGLFLLALIAAAPIILVVVMQLTTMVVLEYLLVIAFVFLLGSFPFLIYVSLISGILSKRVNWQGKLGFFTSLFIALGSAISFLAYVIHSVFY